VSAISVCLLSDDWSVLSFAASMTLRILLRVCSNNSSPLSWNDKHTTWSLNVVAMWFQYNISWHLHTILVEILKTPMIVIKQKRDSVRKFISMFVQTKLLGYLYRIVRRVYPLSNPVPGGSYLNAASDTSRLRLISWSMSPSSGGTSLLCPCNINHRSTNLFRLHISVLD